jgi:hypothetical protein
MKKKIMKAPVEDIDHIGQRLLQRFVWSISTNWNAENFGQEA